MSFSFYVSTFVEVREQEEFLVSVCGGNLIIGQKMVFIHVLS